MGVGLSSLQTLSKGGYASSSIFALNVFSVPENYLDVCDLAYYNPTELQSGVDVPLLPDGQQDAVRMLYSNQSVHEFVSWPDSNNTNPYDVQKLSFLDYV